MTSHIDIKGNIAQQGATQVNNVNFTTSHTTEDIDRLCLRTLRCPDSVIVKNRLEENKDKLLSQSIEWFLQDLKYKDWQDGDKLCLLWIKGGAGKGKTMMSIGVIERLLLSQNNSTLVTYFFCQNADYELNTLEAIIKGLILQLVNRQEGLKKCLRNRWDNLKNCFVEDVTSWRTLWNILLEMLDQCNDRRVYIIVDGLDECQDDGMADFLRLIVRNGLDQPARIKWLLTSRPLDSAQRELLAGHDQVQVSLELNSRYVSEAVKIYITEKVKELDRRAKYGETLKQEVESELTIKAEGTFLWVSLVCKKLESVHRDTALATIQNLPPGLQPFYDRIFHQLGEGEQTDVKKYMRLLRVMMLAYRPLKVEEVGSVTGLTDKGDTIKALVNQCASFIRMHENNIEFVHQSARDYLMGKIGQSILDSHEHYGHQEIVQNCLSYLSRCLQVNLIGLPQPDSTRELLKTGRHERQNVLIASMDYTATFWVQHFADTRILQRGRTIEGMVSTFLHERLLEWLECLSLLERLPQAIRILITLANAIEDNHSASMLVQDATGFLLRHYQTLANWPLQTYSSALIFSPESSVVRIKNADKIPKWLRKVPRMEEAWASLIRTLSGHSHHVTAVAFSPDGRQIASGSIDRTIKLWDVATGDLLNTLTGHPDRVTVIAFSPDSRQIASGSDDRTIKLWDATTGDLQKTLTDHLDRVTAVAFSPDSRQIASGSDDRTIKLWDTETGDLQNTLTGHSDYIKAVAFSPDGEQIASGSDDRAIKLWDTATGDLQKTLSGHSDWVRAVAFSPDGQQIASGSDDRTIKLWDTATGDLQTTLAGHSHCIRAVAFSPDGQRIASGSIDRTIKLWDVATGDLQKTPAGHSGQVTVIAFSPDGQQIASGSDDRTIKLWDVATGDLRMTLTGHTGRVTAVAFSPDSRQIASGSIDRTIKLWDVATGDLQKTLTGHAGRINAVAFSSDGRQLASGSDDCIIKLWDNEKCLKASKYLGRTLGSRLKFRSWQKIKTSEPIQSMKFSAGNQCLSTNIGPVWLENIPPERKVTKFDSLSDLYIGNQWIYYGVTPFLRLPSDFQSECHDVQGDKLAIGFRNGQVWSFDIDRNNLQHTLGYPSV